MDAATPAIPSPLPAGENIPLLNNIQSVTSSTTTAQGEIEPALEANGAGRIELYGAFQVVAEGIGTLTVNDSCSVTWEDDDRVQMTRDGDNWRYTVNTMTNEVRVVGADVEFVFEGERLRIEVQGNGTAILTGDGSYSEPDRSGRWSRTGETIQVQSQANLTSLSRSVTTGTTPLQMPNMQLPSGGNPSPAPLAGPRAGSGRGGQRPSLP